MPVQFATPIIRFRDRETLGLRYELKDWTSFNMSSFWRKPGSARLLVNFESIPVEYTEVSTVIEFRFGEITFAGPLIRRSLKKVAGGRSWTLEFGDYLWWLTTRLTVPELGFEHVDPGEVAAETYIRYLIDVELLNPTIENRRFHIPAILEPVHDPLLGNTVELPSRYTNIASEIEKACISGNVGIVAELNSMQQIEFGVRVPENRIKGTDKAIIYSTDLGTALAIDYNQKTGIVKNSVIALGQGEGAFRNRVIRRDESSIARIGLREQALDSRNAVTLPALESLGDEELERLLEHDTTFTITLPENTSGSQEKPGRIVTVDIPELELSHDILIHGVRASIGSESGLKIQCDLGPPPETEAEVIARVSKKALISEFA